MLAGDPSTLELWTGGSIPLGPCPHKIDRAPAVREATFTDMAAILFSMSDVATYTDGTVIISKRRVK